MTGIAAPATIGPGRGRRSLATAVLAAGALLAGLVPGALAPAEAAPSVTRVAGTDRFDTAARLAVATWPDGAGTVYVADGLDWPDALAATPAAAADDAPILLTARDSLPEATAAALGDLSPDRVVVLGGTAAVSRAVATAMGEATGASVERIAGANRYETAARAALEARPDGSEVVYVASGEGYADALAAGVRAAADGAALVLTSRDVLQPAAAQAIATLDPTTVVLVGGTAAVGGSVADALRDGGRVVERIAGDTRYATAAALAGGGGSGPTILAAGAGFADALAAGPVAARSGAALLLARRTCIPDVAADAIGTGAVTVVGGTAALGPAVAALVRCGADAATVLADRLDSSLVDQWAGFPAAVAAGWAEPDFFPIGVWKETAYNAVDLASVGINLIVHPINDGSNLLEEGDRSGMTYLTGEEWSQAEIGDNPYVVGWSAEDECDMGFGRCRLEEGEDPSRIVDAQRELVEQFRSYDDGRFIHANYGKAILDLWWNPENMPALVDLVDVASGDLYFATDPNLPYEAPKAPAWPAGAEVRHSSSYGWGVDRLEASAPADDPQPTWFFVELGHPFTEASAPTMDPDRMEGAVWSSIVHGARGILYFNHSFGGSCQTQHVLADCTPAIRDRVRRVDAEIRAMAPVLNAPTVDVDVATQADTLVKLHDGVVYVIASVGDDQHQGSFRIQVPEGLQVGRAEIVGTGESLAIVDGAVTATFDGPHDHVVVALHP